MPFGPMLTLTMERNGQDSLLKASTFLKDTNEDPFALKWFILAIHSCLHNFMLAALAGSGQEGIWEIKEGKNGVEKEMVEYQTLADGLRVIDSTNPKNRLMPFMQAYEHITDPGKMHRYTHSKPFLAEDKHTEAMKFLNNELRNVLVHLIPGIHGMTHDYIATCVPVVDIIEFLLFESGQIIHLNAQQDVDSARKAIESIRADLEKLLLAASK